MAPAMLQEPSLTTSPGWSTVLCFAHRALHSSDPVGTHETGRKSMLSQPTYVLITPARNEAQFIEQTIQSVVAQTVRPMKWVIVSDGSTDETDDIVKHYASRHDW